MHAKNTNNSLGKFTQPTSSAKRLIESIVCTEKIPNQALSDNNQFFFGNLTRRLSHKKQAQFQRLSS